MFVSGKVVFFDVRKGWGFIKENYCPTEYFVHYSDIVSEVRKYKVLQEGEDVFFIPCDDKKGKIAKEVYVSAETPIEKVYELFDGAIT